MIFSVIICSLLGIVAMNLAFAATSNIAELIIPGMYTNLNFVQTSSLSTNILLPSLADQSLSYASVATLSGSIVGQPKTNLQTFTKVGNFYQRTFKGSIVLISSISSCFVI